MSTASSVPVSASKNLGNKENLQKSAVQVDRFDNIKRKLNSLKDEVEQESLDKLLRIDEILNKLDENMQIQHKSLSLQLDTIRDEAYSVETYLQQCIGARNEMEEQAERQSQEIVFKFQVATEKIQEEQIEFQASLNQNIQQKALELQAELQSEVLERNNQINTIYEASHQDILKLDVLRQEASSLRAERDIQLSAAISDRLTESIKLLDLEISQSREGLQSIYDFGENILVRVQNELAIERKKRKQVEDTFLNLLDQTTSKLQQASKF